MYNGTVETSIGILFAWGSSFKEVGMEGGT